MKRENGVAIIGLGYVGLPLALLAEKKGKRVIGIDSDKAKIVLLKKNISYIDDIESAKRLRSSNINFTDDLSLLSETSIAVICVPTPVSNTKIPDLNILKSATINSAKHLKKGSLLIIESTINPGVCDEVLIPAIEAATSHVINKTLFLAHCPERINPGDKKWHVGNINRVLGASSAKALDMAYGFYSTLVDADIKKMNSLKEAEAVKVVENSFRDINIAFVNELAMSFEKLGINTNNVIDGAATKPFSFMPHYPGIGVGGHCIPVDPYYLIEYAKGRGFNHHFLKLARSINENMPIHAVSRVEEKVFMMENGGLKDKKIAVLGLSYKANVGDDRESPAYTVISELKRRGAIVSTYDPFIQSKSSCTSLEEAVSVKDAIILVTNHDEFNDIDTSDISEGCIFYDGRNMLGEKFLGVEKVHYIAIGSP